jgi:TatD DNase family protein
MLVDSHCHLDFPELLPRIDEIAANMRAHQVAHALCVSVNLEDFPRVRALADRFDNMYASVGVHPDHEGGEEPNADRLVELAAHPRVVAIGETGLDYYRHPELAPLQQVRFREHIRAARRTGKPLIIHTREAAADTLRLMREEGAAEVGGVMHCFTESWEVAEAAIALNFHISFSGIVTFKNAVALKDVARRVPADRLLVETDSPYLAPVPHRGKLNEPGFVRHVADEVARLRQVDTAEIERQTTANFFGLFKHAAALSGLG